MPKVNPKILVWARETARLSREDAADELGLSGPDRLEALEQGTRDPSRRQLLNMAAKYHRPLLAFYLPEPPGVHVRGQDFRTLPEGQVAESEALLDVVLRDVYARQELVRAALEEAEDDDALSFVGSAAVVDGVDRIANSIRETLGFRLEDFRAQRTVADAFAVLRASAENAGVFVLLIGNLGTHHTNIDASIFRGFAIADSVAPFVVINENDSRAAWSFTLLHELAHVWLGQTGVSGYQSNIEIERFCDAVAARLLLSTHELAEIAIPENLGDFIVLLNEFAGRRKLSRKMVAYNLLISNRINPEVYANLAAILDADRITRNKERAAAEGGPNYYVVRRHRLGHALVNLVGRMVAAGVLSTTKAAKVLGVKPTSVDRIVDGSKAA